MKLQSTLAIETEGLVKRFGDKTAVHSCVSLAAAVVILSVPLTFASNAFVDPQTMPGWVQVSVAAVEVAWVLAWSAALVAVFAPLTMRLYNKER